MDRKALTDLLDTEDVQHQRLQQIVLDAIEEEKLLSDKLHEFEDKHLSLPGKMADKVASFGGSWKFIIYFLVFIIGWVIVNLYLVTKPFDPYPFILLNLFLSMLAAFQAPVIMMSQNRKEEKDRQRAINDYLINLKAEIEIRNMHRKLDLLIADQMKTLFELQNIQVELMEEIKKALQKPDEQ